MAEIRAFAALQRGDGSDPATLTCPSYDVLSWQVRLFLTLRGLLQHLILGPLLGLDAAQTATTDRLSCPRDFDEAVNLVHHGPYDLAFILPAPPAGCVRDVSLAGQVMPQKSIFFYPKLASGFILRTLEN